MKATVLQDGTIAMVEVISGHPLLIPLALELAKHCQHAPLEGTVESRQSVVTWTVPFNYMSRDPIQTTPVPGSGR